MKRYPLFHKDNLPAYATVMSTWAIVTVASAVTLVLVTGSLSMVTALVWAAATAMAGMAIMFVASVLNLRKLTPGFQRLAAGERDPQIPPVWCPVLTAATNAAVEMTAKMHDRDSDQEQALRQPSMPVADRLPE